MIYAPINLNVMGYVIRGLLVLLGMFLIACTSAATPAGPPVSASPTASAPETSNNPVESSRPPAPANTPDRVMATSTPVPTSRPTTIPVPGLPSDLLDSVDQSEGSEAANSPDEIFPAAPDRDLHQLAAQLSLKTEPSAIPLVVNPDPVSYSQGREDTFWLVDFGNMSVYQSDFDLRLVSPHAYWYVEKGQPVLQRDLLEASREFEDRIYPRVTAAFGREWSPGVDNDPHLNIIHARLQGVAGYYSSSDEHPEEVNPYSNEREAIYINTRSLSVGGQSYLEVLAHELQHAIHWNGDFSEDTWVNEGLSELAVTVAGYRSSSLFRFMRLPTVSLVHWPLDNTNISAHYCGASLFMHYQAEHYSTDNDLRPLVSDPADGISGINSYLENQGYNTNFRQVFSDWVVANLLDEEQGRYSYGNLDVQATIGKFLDHFSQIDSEIPQYSAEYIQLDSLAGPIRIRFEGVSENRLLSVDVGDHGCWWSNSGDSISSSLTHSVDLRNQAQATLSYQVWYSVEEDWDYGYLQVSSDGGLTWDILETPNTSLDNPIGNSFGPGYTGDSHGWITERIDLSPYAGREILVRFHYITDDAVNGAGMCFRNITIPEAGLLENDQDWQAGGFILTDNRVKQDYQVKVIQVGVEDQVLAIPLDANNSGELVIPAPHNLNRLVVAVAALAPKTLQPAPYTLTVEPAN